MLLSLSLSLKGFIYEFVELHALAPDELFGVKRGDLLSGEAIRGVLDFRVGNSNDTLFILFL